MLKTKKPTLIEKNGTGSGSRIKIRRFDEIGRRISYERAAEVLGISTEQVRDISRLTKKEQTRVLRILNRRSIR